MKENERRSQLCLVLKYKIYHLMYSNEVSNPCNSLQAEINDFLEGSESVYIPDSAMGCSHVNILNLF